MKARTDQQRLARMVAENPFAYLSHAETRTLFGFGEDSMRALVALGPPIVAGKINPGVFAKWLSANRDRIGKLTT